MLRSLLTSVRVPDDQETVAVDGGDVPAVRAEGNPANSIVRNGNGPEGPAGCGLPDSHTAGRDRPLIITSPAGQSCAVVVERQRGHEILRAGIELADWLSGTSIPDLDPVPRGGGQLSMTARGDRHDTIVALNQRGQLLAVSDVRSSGPFPDSGRPRPVCRQG